jgi:hypothetical protein
LRSHQLCSYSRTSQHFTEPESSLPCFQEHSTGLHPEPDQSSQYHLILSKIHFNIVQSTYALVFLVVSLFLPSQESFVIAAAPRHRARHGPHRKHSFQKFLYCCVLVSCGHYLPMTVVQLLISRSLPSNGSTCHNTFSDKK